MNKREKEKKQLRYASAKERAEKVESGFGPSAIKVPKDFPLFSFKKQGVYRLSILPYVVGKGNRFADEGFVHYERTYFTHKIGMDEKHYCCLMENFKKPCPVCEFLGTLDKWGKDKDLYNALRPKQRQIFALEDQGDKDKEIQIFETSYFFGLGEFIDNKVKANPDRYQGFYYLKGGYVLDVSVQQGAYQGRTNYKVKNLEMEVERKDLPEDTLDRVPCLDDLLVELPYKEMKEIFLMGAKKGGKAGEENGSEPEGLRNRGTGKTENSLIGSQVRYQKQKCTVIKIQNDGSLNLEDPDGGVIRGIDPEDVEIFSSHDESPAHSFEAGDEIEYNGEACLVKRLASDGTLVLEDSEGETLRGIDPADCKKASKKRASKPVVDDDEEDDDDEDEPPKKPSKKTAPARVSHKDDEDEEEEDEDEDEDEDDDD